MFATYQGIRFTDSDIVNLDEFGSAGGFPNLYLVHDHGFVVGLAFAHDEGDAMDILADAEKLDTFKLTDAELTSGDYGSEPELTCSFLGNHSEPYDIEAIGIVQVPIPPVSFVGSFNATLVK